MKRKTATKAGPAVQGRRERRLTAKQELFALTYFRLMDASAAYREVYAPEKATAKTINEAASRLLKNSKVAARVAELRERVAAKSVLTVERTHQEIARLAYSDPRKFYDEAGNLIPIHKLDDDAAACVASIEVDEMTVNGAIVGYTKKIKHWDKNSALEKAMKHLGQYELDNKQHGLAAIAEMMALVDASKFDVKP